MSVIFVSNTIKFEGPADTVSIDLGFVQIKNGETTSPLSGTANNVTVHYKNSDRPRTFAVNQGGSFKAQANTTIKNGGHEEKTVDATDGNTTHFTWLSVGLQEE